MPFQKGKSGNPGGRRKGSRNKASAKREAEIAASGKTPLEYLLEHMRDESAPVSERMDCAKAAAPYVHPKLASVTVAGKLSIEKIEHVIVYPEDTANSDAEETRSLVNEPL
jgi:hypothetical protein